MDESKLERKLRRKARKLARWMRRNGIDHVGMFVIGHTEEDPRWYADVTAHIGDVRVVSAGDFYEEGEL